MPHPARSVHVCSLARMPSLVEGLRASHLMSLIREQGAVERPLSIAEENHLRLDMNDIDAPRIDLVHPNEQHVAALIAFAQAWHQQAPLVIHCWAGISRSTAAAYVTACALAPDLEETALARRLRAASPTATPNRLIVALADDALGRRGRMVDAVAAIGRGEEAMEGRPFHLVLD
ncbi:MAG: protein tyrosine phosphatase [Hyphomicrobiaceae bacterium]